MNQVYSADVRFREEQRMPPIICWMVTVISPTLSVGVLYYVFFMQNGARNMALSMAARAGLMAVVTVGELAIALWLHMTRLVVEVGSDLLRIRYAPFSREDVSYSDIASVESRTCNPLMEFGGWGVRSSRNGRAYVLMGNRGVQLELKGNKRLFISSLRPDELAQAIKNRIH